ncbi:MULTISPECIES: hypothetical protein [Alphaproteobacteria]|uniref:DUF883 domain-containing protein n=2 Tax=Alphaproteobacteria TaxID=28211 RepID=A0A512HQE2_9HYPH|nr:MULTISPECIES: hypothetical protein [Alphaproteobacteria]GEO87649.1 hypothetical protein RNA01_45810 [Ciceribacter naphthalenivorans]GLR23907.1 hypothetical protein GCM10007920_37010 [Ciceribacter naphthalenivorans]GLT06763.1 hypothetical protein GCM10007926_37010 [Sphingomonas psychrolutea]
MSLMKEIQDLGAQIEAHARKAPPTKEHESMASTSDEPLSNRAAEAHQLETFLKTANETLDEFAEELDRFPRLTALAAFGIGLAAGVVIGSRL